MYDFEEKSMHKLPIPLTMKKIAHLKTQMTTQKREKEMKVKQELKKPIK